jgi:hypothetical protein
VKTVLIIHQFERNSQEKTSPRCWTDLKIRDMHVTIACDKTSTNILRFSVILLFKRTVYSLLPDNIRGRARVFKHTVETVILDHVPERRIDDSGAKGKKQPPQTNPPTHARLIDRIWEISKTLLRFLGKPHTQTDNADKRLVP